MDKGYGEKMATTAAAHTLTIHRHEELSSHPLFSLLSSLPHTPACVAPLTYVGAGVCVRAAVQPGGRTARVHAENRGTRHKALAGEGVEVHHSPLPWLQYVELARGAALRGTAAVAAAVLCWTPTEVQAMRAHQLLLLLRQRLLVRVGRG